MKEVYFFYLVKKIIDLVDNKVNGTAILKEEIKEEIVKKEK
jgi:hypothetical protein